MIGYLEGKLKHKSPDTIIIDVHGVGYFVNISLSTFYDLPEPGQSVTLNIHTYFREDTLQLYGFQTVAEKEMFLHLITVNGIGPRLAVAILSGMNPDSLRQAVQGQDHHRLRSIPGVGKRSPNASFWSSATGSRSSRQKRRSRGCQPRTSVPMATPSQPW